MPLKPLKNPLKHANFACFLAILCSCLLWNPAFSASPEAPETMQKLRNGQVVITDLTRQSAEKTPTVEAQILVPRPIADVRKTVSDPQKIMKNEKKVKSLKLLSKTGNTQLLEYTVMMGKMLPTFNYILRHQQTTPDNIQFKRVSGSFKDFEGGWKMTPVDANNTVVTYRLKLDPGPGLPAFLITSLVKADLTRMMENAKAAILSE